MLKKQLVIFSLIILFAFSSIRLIAATYPTELHNGPMLGCMTDTSVRCWVRTASAVPVQFRVSTSDQMTNPISSNTVTSTVDYGSVHYIGVMEVTGLEPETQYYYQVLINSSVAEIDPIPSFRTFPSQNARTVIKIGFGGGAANPSEDGLPEYQVIWDTINSHDLNAFLFLGDNVYYDKHPGWSGDYDAATRIASYQERHGNTNFRNLISSKPIFAIWDDHDFSDNDCDGSADNDLPTWKVMSWTIFQENFNNPSYGGNGVNGVKGCWFSFSIGMVDFFMLDGRYYRVPYGTANRTMLGPVQKQWLKDQLSASTGVFKVIVSPVPWHDAAKPGTTDPWLGFPEEKAEIFNFIRDNSITGVISLTADRHRADALVNPIDGYYPLYEFENSRLTNSHWHETISHSDWLFSYNSDRIFGIVTFDLTKNDPTITYNVVRTNNETLPTPYKVTINGSQLNVPLFPEGDINKDGKVDTDDLNIMSKEYLDSGIRPKTVK